ncbi:MAG: Gp138 family membrane-puncturing spike protein [Myxococcaceae bacterium]
MITPSLPEVLRQAFDARLASVYTALPGQIERYDAGKADIKVDNLPVLFDVPVIFSVLTFPIKAGDIVQLIFNNHDLSKPIALLTEQKSDDFVALASKILTEFKAITQAFNSHTHGGPVGPKSSP